MNTGLAFPCLRGGFFVNRKASYKNSRRSQILPLFVTGGEPALLTMKTLFITYQYFALILYPCH